MEKQVDKEKYEFQSYCGSDRWASYYHQISEVLKQKPKSILEVGVGDKVFSSYIKNNTSVNYKSLDIADDLSPDVVGSVDDIPLSDNSFDLICAFEILEHLPFERFEQSLKEISRVSREGVIISLPHFGPPAKLSFKIPFLKEVSFAWKIPYLRKHVFNGEHYWEIGKRGYSVKKIRSSIEKHFKIQKEFIPYENQYHHFFVLKNKDYE